MEKLGYRENYERLLNLFPDRASISSSEAASVLGCCSKTVLSAIKITRKPIPAVKVSSKKYLISITDLARWLSSERR